MFSKCFSKFDLNCGKKKQAYAAGLSAHYCLYFVISVFCTVSDMVCFLFHQRDDPSLLAQFYYADEELNLVAGELDTFDGRKDPERCTALVNQLRHCQDKV